MNKRRLAMLERVADRMFSGRNALVLQATLSPAKPRTSVRFRSPPPNNQEFTENIGAERAPLRAWNRPTPPGKVAKPPVICYCR